MPFSMQTADTLVYLTSPLFPQRAVAHGFSTRKGGVSLPPWDSLNLGVGREGESKAAVRENYRRFCAAIGTDCSRVVLSKQVHGDGVRPVTSADAGKGLFCERDYETDALITDVPGLALTVFSADCGIVLLYDPVTHCVGALHSGWRGTARSIAGKTVAEMTRRYGARPQDIRAAIGPCIGACCFETDGDVPAAMTAAFAAAAAPYLLQKGEKWQVDLKGLIALSLRRAGVSDIDVCDLCTAHNPALFWSHRKMGQNRGAQIAQIALL